MPKLLLTLFIPLAFLFSCSPEPSEPTTQSFKTDSVEFNINGDFNFMLEKSATATITLVGGGGGGGGGGNKTEQSGKMTTGAGGGGGAGQVKVLHDIQLSAFVTYKLTVGNGGEGGKVSFEGAQGGSTTITDNAGMTFTANSGKGGLGVLQDGSIGGKGGIGYSNGFKGKNGTYFNAQSNEPPAEGGYEGKNSSDFGNGGVGGKGSSLRMYNGIQAKPGEPGSPGYIKIVYTTRE